MAATVKPGRLSDLDDRVWTLRTFIYLGLVLALITGVLYAFYRHRIGPTAAEYQGIVIDKGIATVESEQGSGSRFWVLIELDTKERHSVYVSREIHGQAEKGMLFIKTTKGIELRPNPTSITAGPPGDKAR